MMQLHPQLKKDCFILGEFSLCSLLLLNDANYPWFILVPGREGISEIYRLPETDQQLLLKESMFFCHCLEQVFQPDKLNIAALGNVVPQLHIHHIVRYKTDACWPAPVWGNCEAVPYKDEQLIKLKQQLSDWFRKHNDLVFHWNENNIS